MSGNDHLELPRFDQHPPLRLEHADAEVAPYRQVLIACDDMRSLIAAGVPLGLLVARLIAATHTHTAPVTREGDYEIPRDGVMPPAAVRFAGVK